MLEKRDERIARLKKRFEKIPKELDLAAELIAERRKEAKRDRDGFFANFA